MNVMGESIQDIQDKFKSFSARFLAEDRLFIALLLVVLVVTAFGLGRLAERAAQTPNPTSVSVAADHNERTSTSSRLEQAVNDTSDIQYVASKSGTKYHLPWCPGAQQMKESNKIYFDSKTAAEAAGYTPAANCKGL